LSDVKFNYHQGGISPFTKDRKYDSYNRIIRVTNPDAGDELIGRYWYDDQGFRVRKVGRRQVSGQKTRDIEVIYSSMYFGIKKHRTTAGAEIQDTDYAVNNRGEGRKNCWEMAWAGPSFSHGKFFPKGEGG